MLILLFVAFCSLSLQAFISADRLRIELNKVGTGVQARALSFLYKHSDKTRIALLIGYTLGVVFASYRLMGQLLFLYQGVFAGFSWLSLPIALLTLFLLLLLVGDALPKLLARLDPSRIIARLSPLLFVLYVLLFPITLITLWIIRLLSFLLRTPVDNRSNFTLRKDDIDNYIESTSKADEGSSAANEVRILQNALDFSDLVVRDLLVPRKELVACEETASKEELTKMFVSTGFSKLLVYRGSIDDLIGYIHAIEMYNESDQPWQARIKDLFFVPETASADKVMKSLITNKKSIAVVVDEFGGTSGIVTLEDIVEEIFGEIEDEHDVRQIVMKQVEDSAYIISGRAEIDAVNERFGLDLPEDEDAKTMSGLIIAIHQGFPKRGEVIEIAPGVHATILRSSKNTISLVKLIVVG